MMPLSKIKKLILITQNNDNETQNNGTDPLTQYDDTNHDQTNHTDT